MLPNPRDAFRGQSKSQNMAPFDMLGMVSYQAYCAVVSLSLRVFRYSDFKNVVTLKSGLEFTQGH